MKLKKLMALALSGVLAVSMFAGCAKGNVKPEPTPDPEEPTATGYSVTLGDKVDVEKDYITYQDNADDAAALQDALGNMASVSVAARECFKTIKVTKPKYRQVKQRHENRQPSFHTG